MNEGVIALLIPIFAVIGLFIVIIFLRKYENEERMAMIEKGMHPVIDKKINPAGVIKWGLLFVGVGLGLLVGEYLYRSTGIEDGIAYFSMIMIFGGIGLLLSYIWQKREDAKKLQ